MADSGSVKLSIELTQEEAWYLAEFLAGLGFHEVRAVARDDEDAHAKLYVAERVRSALADLGYVVA